MKELDREGFERLLQIEDMNELYRLIVPHVDENNPYAIYLYSTFSLPSWQESDVDFDKRRVELLCIASDLGLAEAQYQLACCYLYGEGVQRNGDLAKAYADLAVNQGCEMAINLVNQIER